MNERYFVGGPYDGETCQARGHTIYVEERQGGDFGLVRRGKYELCSDGNFHFMGWAENGKERNEIGQI